MDIIVTLPQYIEWADYQLELDAVADWSGVLNYKVPEPSIPAGFSSAERCYLLWRGAVRGWMKIVGVELKRTGFTCATSGKRWGPGVYIQRSGPFHRLAEPVFMRGFQGWRYWEETI